MLTVCATGFVVAASNLDTLRIIVPRRQALTHFLYRSVKLKSPCVEGVSMGCGELPQKDELDPQDIFVSSCKLLPPNKTVLYVGSQKIAGASDLFYAPVTVGGQSILNGLLDSGSMACTLIMEGESRLRADGVLPQPSVIPDNVVLIGCGGLTI